MANVKVTENQSWLVVIERGPGDDWPDLAVKYGRSQDMFRPDTIRASLDAGLAGYSGSISGYRLRQNGEPGQRPACNTYYRSETSASGWPDWARQLTGQARGLAGLSDTVVTAARVNRIVTDAQLGAAKEAS